MKPAPVIDNLTNRRPDPSEGAFSPVVHPAPIEDLVERARTGCQESFAVLIEQFTPRVYRYLLRMTRNPHDAEDLTQDTLLKAFRALPKSDTPKSFTAWIYTIAHRTALNHFRAARPVQEFMDTDHETRDPDPSRRAESQDEWVEVWNLAAGLKREYYEALWLRYGENLTIEEVAKAMGLGQIHVRVLLHRGRQQLVKRLNNSHLPSAPKSGSPSLHL